MNRPSSVGGFSNMMENIGREIGFERDTENRIVRVVNAGGATSVETTYEYDTAGDLRYFTDLSGQEWEYRYDAEHNLNAIIDPRGINVLNLSYDAQGRLIGTSDALGYDTSVVHDTANVRELVTDPMGHTRIYEYDTDGNVVTEYFRPHNGTEDLVRSMTYDAKGNQLTETDALGHTTVWTFDALNRRTSELLPGMTVATFWTYDGTSDRVLTETDPAGKVTRSCYDGRGNLVRTVYPGADGTTASCTDNNGNFNATYYDGQGNITGIRDPEGNTATIVNNAYGYQTQITYPDGHKATAEYDGRGNQTVKYEEVTVGGQKTTVATRYTYDAMNRVVKTTSHNGAFTQTLYNESGMVWKQQDVLGRWTEYSYQDNGALAVVTYHDGTTESYTYDPRGMKETVTNREGAVTKFLYDARGRQTGTIAFFGTPNAYASSTEYDTLGKVAARTGAGVRVTYTYDAQGRKTTETDPLGRVIRYTYNAKGNTEYVFMPGGPVLRYEYDYQDRKSKTYQHNPATCAYPPTVPCENGILVETVKYNNNNLVAERLDALNRKIAYTYDGFSRLAKTTQYLDGRAVEAHYSYDERGNKLTETNYDGLTTNWQYDAMNRMVTKTHPGGTTETYQHNPTTGAVTGRTDQNGDTTSYAYDAVYQRLITTAYTGAGTLSYTYEPVSGRILTLTDARGVTQYRYYPITGRLHEKENPDGTVETYTYDQYGRLHSRSIGVESWTYLYDTLSRLSTVTRSNGDITTYSWTVQGNLDTVTDFAGGVTRHTYDWRGRLTGIETKNAQNIVETRFTYELDDAGNRTAVTVLDGTRTAYTYNDLNYLIMETVHTGADTFTTYYTYTDGGSILTKETDTGTVEYFYDTTGKLTRTEERDLNGLLLTETAYQYDDNGNTVAVVTDGAALAYGYDRENRLTTVTGAGTNVLYTYDGEGNRVRKSVNGSAVNYLVDTSYANAQVAAEYDDSGTVQAVYHRGLGLISMTQGAAERFYRYDAQGSIRAISNGTAVTDTYTFDAYGNTTSRTGSTENSYQYTGEQRDEETGNYYLRARYYNPGAGQFISRDSWDGDTRNPITLNKYAYANSNPAMYTDPSGHEGIIELSVIQNIVDTMSQTAMAMYPNIPTPEQTAKQDQTALFKNRYYWSEDHAAWDATNFIRFFRLMRT